MAVASATSMTITSVRPTIFSNDPKDRIDFLQQNHLLASAMLCGSCNNPMTMGSKRDISDGWTFRCTSTGCKTTKSVRAGSFFSKSRLSLKQWLVLLYWWVREYSVTQAAEEAEVGRGTAIKVYQWLREVCSTKLIQTPIRLGGPGRVVEIDELLFKHKPKVRCTHDTYSNLNCVLL